MSFFQYPFWRVANSFWLSFMGCSLAACTTLITCCTSAASAPSSSSAPPSPSPFDALAPMLASTSYSTRKHKKTKEQMRSVSRETMTRSTAQRCFCASIGCVCVRAWLRCAVVRVVALLPTWKVIFLDWISRTPLKPSTIFWSKASDATSLSTSTEQQRRGVAAERREMRERRLAARCRARCVVSRVSRRRRVPPLHDRRFTASRGPPSLSALAALAMRGSALVALGAARCCGRCRYRAWSCEARLTSDDIVVHNHDEAEKERGKRAATL